MPQRHDVGHRKKRTRRQQAELTGRYQAPSRIELEDFARDIVRRGLAEPTILDQPRIYRGHHNVDGPELRRRSSSKQQPSLTAPHQHPEGTQP